MYSQAGTTLQALSARVLERGLRQPPRQAAPLEGGIHFGVCQDDAAGLQPVGGSPASSSPTYTS